VVPETADKEPFVLEAREIRGVVSNGMLASPRELGISDEHEGILEIAEELEPGTSFADVFHLNDHIVDIENKMFTHRPDCFGLLGVYREIAGISHQPFVGPKWYNPGGAYSLEADNNDLPVEFHNELPRLVPRFMAISISNVTVGPSPLWLQVNLTRLGLRPINNIVDITNYIMYLTGQPLHAYDYDKVKERSGEGVAAQLVVRHPRPGEKIKLLNGKEIEPRPESVMIATDTTLIGVGGVIGGADTEVDKNTKNIIVECACFDMYSVRRTSMAHGLFTDAVTRFNKGQSPLQNDHVLPKAIHEICDLTGGHLAGELIDDNHTLQNGQPRPWVHLPVPVTTTFVNSRLGLKLSPEDMKTLLENVEFMVTIEDDKLSVAAPFWRTDVETREDVVEEIGRLYGFDKLPLELPKHSIKPAQKDPLLDLKEAVRSSLSAAGANEVLTYSFVHGDLLDKVGQRKDDAYQLHNALSPELQYYRLSLTPSLLDKVHANIKAGYDQFALFELGKAHMVEELDNEGLPAELDVLALVFAANTKAAAAGYKGAPYYQARKYFIHLVADFGDARDLKFVPLAGIDLSVQRVYEQMLQPYEPNRSAAVLRGKEVVGVVGEYRANVRRALKLPDFSAGFGVLLPALQQHAAARYVALPRFPKVEQDITLKVPADVSYQKLHDFIAAELAKVQPPNTLPTLSPLDIYQKPDDTEHKQVTFRLTIASYEKTLRDADVTALLDTIAASAKDALGAVRI
jgi:phenylalanyl-tRNA synthetase beta chain